MADRVREWDFSANGNQDHHVKVREERLGYCSYQHKTYIATTVFRQLSGYGCGGCCMLLIVSWERLLIHIGFGIGLE